MSRHVFTSPAGITWMVGFDPVIASYFAQRESGTDNDEPIDIVGTEIGEVSTVRELQSILDGQVTIPDAIASSLEVDGPTHPKWLRPDLARDRSTAIEQAITQTRTSDQ